MIYKNDNTMALDQAAIEVGISKMSLDDYLLLLRRGCQYGFDFALHAEKSVGTLRKFVR